MDPIDEANLPIKAGKVTLPEDPDDYVSWTTVEFDHAFDTTPVVIAQIQSHNDAEWVRTRIQSVNSQGFQVMLEEDKQDNVHGDETLGWIAVATSNAIETVNDLQYAAVNSNDAVTHEPSTGVINYPEAFTETPLVFAGMQTYDGGDPAGVRMTESTESGVVVFVEEETCSDADMEHTTEMVGVIAFNAELNGCHIPSKHTRSLARTHT